MFQCADGAIVIAAGTQSLWRSFCGAIDRPDLLEDERFDALADRVANVDELEAEIEPVIESRSIERWIETFHEHSIPAGPIHDTQSVWDDDVKAAGLHEVMHREGQTDAHVIDHPVHFRNLATSLRTPPEELGESTGQLLERVGYASDEIERLRLENVVD